MSFTDLQTAIDAASPGDALLVKSGTYGDLGLDGKGLTIFAGSDEAVAIAGTWEVSNVPA